MRITAKDRPISTKELLLTIAGWISRIEEPTPVISLTCAECDKAPIEGDLLGINFRERTLAVLQDRKDRTTLVRLSDVASFVVQIHGREKWTIEKNEGRESSCEWMVKEMERTIEPGPGL